MTGSSDLLDHLRGLSAAEIVEVVEGLPEVVVEALLSEVPAPEDLLPPGPLEQAQELDDGYEARAHLTYLSEQIAGAVADVERGISRKLIVSMPPRLGKSTLVSHYLPVWLLRKHPDWSLALISHEGNLATSWGRQIRRTFEGNPALGVTLAADAGAASEWETTARGSVIARGIRGSFTGRGARVLIIDDPVKDFVEAHSTQYRQAAWDWWLTVAFNRLEPPSLVIVVMTRWHEDDLAGRLLSPDHEGDPDDWTEIRFPALAEEGDLLGREPGEPLISPLVDETPEEALARWADVREAVGTYTFSAMHQQRPAPAKGGVFDVSWFRYWTTDPSKVTEDGRVVLIDPDEIVRTSRVLESWDMAFKKTESSDYVVGQRWAAAGVRRYLLAQSRARRSFTESVREMEAWAEHPHAPYVSARLVEDKANGTAVLDTLKEKVPLLVPVSPTESKEARARAISPTAEAGNIYIPHPSEFGWVKDFISEVRNFPTDANDDQVDGMTQAVYRLRSGGVSTISNPDSRPAASPGALTRIAGRSIRDGGGGSRPMGRSIR